MLLRLLRQYSGAIISLLFWGGLEVSPYESLLWAIILWVIAGLWAIIATVLWFINKRKLEIIVDSETSQVLGITNILQKMHTRLMELEKKEARRLFNPLRYLFCINVLNSHLGIAPEKLNNPYDIEEAKGAVATMEADMLKKYGNLDAESYFNELNRLKEVSSYLESKKYGLKKTRGKDNVYKEYKNTLEMLKNKCGDEELREMIIDHVDYSEVFANITLLKDRSLRIVSWVKWRPYNFSSLASVDAQIRTEDIETGISKFLSEIRFIIGKRIKEMENQDNQETTN